MAISRSFILYTANGAASINQMILLQINEAAICNGLREIKPERKIAQAKRDEVRAALGKSSKP